MNYIIKILKHYNVLETNTRSYLAFVILVVVIILACVIVNFIIKKIILRIVGKIMRKDKFQSTTILLERKVFEKLADIIPAIIIYMSAPAFKSMSVAVHRFASAYILVAILFVISALLEAVNDIYKTRPVSNVRPIKGLLQVIKIILVVIISIVLLANLMGENPAVLLGGIGALAVAFSFVFKDTILGFIAGIQLTSDDMLRIGDWIEMPKHGASGAVIDINLTTVKVQNPDKSIVNIPAYALISDSFKNWRGMTDFGARRIRRIINIDVTSICFCTSEMLINLQNIPYMKEYLSEIEFKPDLTNLGILDIYIKKILEANPVIMNDMPIVVSQMPAGENGLPIEISGYTTVIDWETSENIQADIFNHIVSTIQDFNLRTFQNPTGYDIQHMKTK